MELEIHVYEGAGTPQEVEFKAEDMSGQESSAIEDAIHTAFEDDVIPSPDEGRVEASIDSVESVIRLKDANDGAIPFPEDWVATNGNTRFVIQPRKYGRNDWRHPVHVEFRTMGPTGGRRRGKGITRRRR